MANEFMYEGAPKDWPQIQVLRRIWRASFMLQTLHQPHFREISLPMVEFDVLSTLGNTSGLTMEQLTDMVISAPADIVKECAAMERKGLLKRQTSGVGTREVVVRLTDKGEQLFDELFARTVNYSARILDTALSEPELKSLARLLEKLIDSVCIPQPEDR